MFHCVHSPFIFHYFIFYHQTVLQPMQEVGVMLVAKVILVDIPDFTLKNVFVVYLKFKLKWPLGFPDSSVGKESAYNAGDLVSVLGSGRSRGEGNGYHSSILAWTIPWTEEPGGLQSLGHKQLDTTKHTHMQVILLHALVWELELSPKGWNVECSRCYGQLNLSLVFSWHVISVFSYHCWKREECLSSYLK